MAMNTPYLGQASVQTTDFTSDLSVFGTSVFSSDVQFLSTTSFVGAQATGAITAAGAIVGSSTLSMVGASTLAATTVGSGGSSLAAIYEVESNVVQTTCTGNTSVQTTLTSNAAALGDLVLCAPLTASGISADVVATAFVSANSTIAIRFSNVSSVDAVQSAGTWYFGVIKFT